MIVQRINSVFGCLSAALLVVGSGCAAIHPVKGIPVEQLATDCESRSDKSTIDLSLLVQTKPDQYRVGPKDVLSVYVPGVLGRLTDRDDEIGEAPPINQPQNPADIPTLGFPLTVRDDGTLPLPQVPPIHVNGLTLAEVEAAILRAYTIDSQVLNAHRPRVIVSISRPREYEVLVVRQEKSSDVAPAGPGIVNVGKSRKGTARIVRLPAYQNDVLHALAKERDVDGLPGLDAENTIYIIRRRNRGDVWPTACETDGCRTDGYPISNHGSSTFVGPAFSQPAPQDFAPTYSPMPAASGGRYPTNDVQQPTVSPMPYNGGRYAPANPMPQSDPVPMPAVSPGMPAVSPMAPFPSTGHSSLPPLPPAGNHAIHPAAGIDGFRTLRPSTDGVIRGQSPGSRFPLMPGHSAAPIVQTQCRTCPAPPAYPMGHGGDFAWQDTLTGFDPTVKNPHVIKIPVRLAPGERPCLAEKDIILEDGDIVFIESRETEVFYTAGLLGGGQWELPRDYDLRLLEAISIAQGPQNVQSVGNANGRAAINADVTVSGSRVVIMRTLPGGARMPIETTIYKAIKHPEEHNIKILPGDMIYLQYTCTEGVLAFFERHLLESALFGVATGFAIGND